MPNPAPTFEVTNVGLAAASVATPTGPFIEITGFRIGSGFGYVPQPTDTDINGTLLYQGTPTSYRYAGDNTIDIICQIPADAGPFDFGEVTVDLAGPVMFAKAVFDTPLTKYTSLGTNVLSTFTFHCLLKLEQSTAVFKIVNVLEQPDIWSVDHWSDVYPPSLMANPEIPAILVQELDLYGNSTLIAQASGEQWSVQGNYRFIGLCLTQGGDLNTVTANVADLPPSLASDTVRNYVVELESGYMRSCSSVTSDGTIYTFTFVDPLTVAPVTGTTLKVHSNTPLAPMTLNAAGDVTGTVVLDNQTATLNLTINQQSIASRQITYDAAGTYEFIVPAGVFNIYVDAGGAGGGGGGAGSGISTDHVIDANYYGGGGGGGGGAGVSVKGQQIAVSPFEAVTITIGGAGPGGAGAAPTGQDGVNGQAGGDTTIQASTLLTFSGGTGGRAGFGYGPPSNNTGGGGTPGSPGGSFGTDGYFGGAGGNGGSSPFGTGGTGGRAATNVGEPGNAAVGNSTGGGGGGAPYYNTSTTAGGAGSSGTDGFCEITW